MNKKSNIYHNFIGDDMIKAIEKDLLEDNFLNTSFINNISINDKINFNLNDIYYFGNYNRDKLNIIKRKINNNKYNIKKAVNRGVKFIITGNSIKLFNNNFNTNDINLFNLYNDSNFKHRRDKLKFKKLKSNYKIKHINDLNNANNSNFRYKNLICISDKITIDQVIKKTKYSTLS